MLREDIANKIQYEITGSLHAPTRGRLSPEQWLDSHPALSFEQREILTGTLQLCGSVGMAPMSPADKGCALDLAKQAIQRHLADYLYGEYIADIIPIMHELLENYRRKPDLDRTPIFGGYDRELELLLQLRDKLAEFGTSNAMKLQLGRR